VKVCNGVATDVRVLLRAILNTFNKNWEFLDLLGDSVSQGPYCMDLV